jgi:hypothetical protein
MGPGERAEFFGRPLSPEVYVNLTGRGPDASIVAEVDAGQPEGLYLLGDAASLYFTDALGPTRRRGDEGPRVIYHTTWDTSPLGEAIRADGSAEGDPGAWSAWLNGRGIGRVLVSYPELTRLAARDRNFDPAVTIDAVKRWIGDERARLRSERQWASDGGEVHAELFRIGPMGITGP